MANYSNPMEFFDENRLSPLIRKYYGTNTLFTESIKFGFRYGYAVGLCNACRIQGCEPSKVDEMLERMMPNDTV